MVLGLGGTLLPPRPRRVLPAGAAGEQACMVRVQSNSGLASLPVAYPSSAACTAVDAVCTPTGESPFPQQPAISDQSNTAAAALQPADAGGEPAAQSVLRRQPGEGQRDVWQAVMQPQAAVMSHYAAPIEHTSAGLAGAQQAPGVRRSAHAPAAGPGSSLAPDFAAAAGAAAAGPASGSSSRKRQRSSSQQAQHDLVGASSRPQRASRLGASQAAAAAATGSLPAAAAAAAPAGKRHKGLLSSGHRPSKYSDIMHRTVVVPGSVFFVEGQVYIGRVNKSESGRRVPSVEVQFLDDASKYWFPVADVRCWMAAMVRSGSWERYNPGVPAPDFQSILAGAAAAVGGPGVGAARARSEEEDEKEAAHTLQSLSASLVSSRRAGPAVSTGGGGGGGAAGAQPAVSSKRQRQQRGALDIMATAAGLGCGAHSSADLA